MSLFWWLTPLARSVSSTDEAAIEQVISEFVTYGTRRVAKLLRRLPQAMLVNRKRVQLFQ